MAKAPIMRRKSVRKVLKSIAQLRATLRSERDRIGGRLGQRLGAPIGAAQAYRTVLEHLEAELAALDTDLADAEDAYARVKQRLAELRQRRGRAASGLYKLHAPVQRLLASFPEGRGAGIVGLTAAAPRPLAEQAARTVDFLRQLEHAPPPPIRGIIIDPGAAASDLEAAGGRLEAVLEELEGAEARAAAARAEAETVIAHAGSVAPWVTRAIEGLAGLSRASSVGGRVRSRVA